MTKFRTRSKLPPPKKHPQGSKSLTQQNFAGEADINRMVDRHMKGPGRFGQPIGNPNASRQPFWGEVPAESFHDMLNKVSDIQSAFRSLPSRLRNRFANSPYQLMRWVENPQNRKEAVKAGLIHDPELLNEVRAAEAAADREAHAAGQEPAPGQQDMLRPDPEAQPRHTPSKAGKKPNPDPTGGAQPA